MKCHSVQKKLSAYQDRELKPREQEEVTRHLLSCQSCREQYEKLERVWQTLGEFEEICPDPWFYGQLVRKIEQPRGRGLLPMIERFFQLLRTPTIASILLTIGILTGTYLGNILIRCDFSTKNIFALGLRLSLGVKDEENHLFNNYHCGFDWLQNRGAFQRFASRAQLRFQLRSRYSRRIPVLTAV